MDRREIGCFVYEGAVSRGGRYCNSDFAVSDLFIDDFGFHEGNAWEKEYSDKVWKSHVSYLYAELLFCGNSLQAAAGGHCAGMECLGVLFVYFWGSSGDEF